MQGYKLLTRSEMTIFNLLELVEKRPAMFIRDESLHELSSLIWGYYAALKTHGIIENVPSMDNHFMSWLHYRTDWSPCAGWANEIEKSVNSNEKPIDLFFFFVNEYKKLDPIIKSRIELNTFHNPTGKRITIGADGIIEKPKSIEIIQYYPKPLHFLRLHYDNRIENFDLLMKDLGDYETSVESAKFWVLEEFQIKFEEWHDI